MFHAPLPVPFLILVLIIVLLFGGKKLPELAKGLGEGLREFKKATQHHDEDDAAKAEQLAKTSGGTKAE
jgi:sec-independent protein translocase protein TatA